MTTWNFDEIVTFSMMLLSMQSSLNDTLIDVSGQAAKRQASAASGRTEAEGEKMVGRWSAASVC